MSVAAEAAGRSASGGDDEARARAAERSMRDELAAHDLAIGLGRGGPLVSAAHEAASSPNAPDVGATTLEVDCDAAGAVVTARADDRVWGDVAKSLVRAMNGKTLRLRRDAHGMRVRLRVVAERTLPSGSRGSSSPGALPDDVPGGGKACDGEGITRRCVAGMPLGATNSQHDVSNAGAKRARSVHVHLLSESEL
jgi:hypothetical protein